ncbi:carboxymuconolactone decarboxylase family protein [Nonomuraea sp. NPDC000554]|uniref:carboxymuconolactone decarboxylase family protein n=1 Tax=Nonomuraea sp. NPDC000554 TaxID=3154259 RepID=UPI00331E3ADA
MEPRLNLSGSPLAAKSMRHFASASKVIIDGSTLPSATHDLVMLRASQINGRGFCTDMHSKDLAHAGETSVANRLNVIVQQPAGDYQPGQFG